MSAPNFQGSQYMAPAATSAKFSSALLVGRTYRLTSNVDVFFKQGDTDVAATVGANSHLLCAGQDIPLNVSAGSEYLALITLEAPDGVVAASVSLISNL
jgi:hypothetical protein